MKTRVLTLAVVVLARMGWAQVPAGPEFLVNVTTAYNQDNWNARSVAMSGDGSFVVVWQNSLDSGPVPDDYDVRGRRFAADGTPIGSEFVVSSAFTSSFASPTPAVAGSASGAFVVTWWQQGGWPSPRGIFARRYDPAGAPLGPQFLVNSSTPPNAPNAVSFPAVATNDAGRFVIAWPTRYGPSGDTDSIAARIFDAAGAAIGPDFTVPSYTTGPQLNPTLDMDAAGNFVVAWKGPAPPSTTFQILGQKFDPAGARIGTEFRANTYTTAFEASPSLGMDSTGAFVVVWQRSPVSGGGSIVGRRFAATGSPMGGEFEVAPPATFSPAFPSLAVETGGAFTVSWDDDDGSSSGGVKARRFDAAATPAGAAFLVNAYTTGVQTQSSVAAGPAGNFVVAWTSTGGAQQDGSGTGVFARRFGGLLPASLLVDATARPGSNGNGVLEAGETADVAPSWRNVSGAARVFGGVASGFTGPAPGGSPTYTIADGAASYGSVPHAATGSCTATADCYALGISLPAARPAVHWDASMVEHLVPTGHVESTTYTLHVGDSFMDVPRASGFYRFVETILHKGVTGGCAAASYCPAASTTREQMAVFVLLSKEQAGYLPPACGATPMFTDVPVSSPFCRWVEELARRGVTSGCGPGLYCPATAVTRDQMAVFVLRTLDPALNPPACGTPVFADVPAASPFCRWIEELVRRGVVSGCGGGNYCPASPVTRDQMAVFLTVTFSLTLYGV